MRRQIRLAHKLILLVILTAGVTVIVPSILVIRGSTRTLEQQVGELTRSEARRGGQLVALALNKDVGRVIALLNELERSDAIVLASPMNFWTVTAVMKRFIERLLGSAWPW